MGDKAQVPRIKEQHKDNAVEVVRNEPSKAGLQREDLRNKSVEIQETEMTERCS